MIIVVDACADSSVVGIGNVSAARVVTSSRHETRASRWSATSTNRTKTPQFFLQVHVDSLFIYSLFPLALKS